MRFDNFEKVTPLMDYHLHNGIAISLKEVPVRLHDTMGEFIFWIIFYTTPTSPPM